MKKKEITIEDLARMVQGGFDDSRKYMDKRFEQVDKRFEQVDKRFEQVDSRFKGIDQRLDIMDRRLSSVEDGQLEIRQLLKRDSLRNEIKEMDKKFEKRISILERKLATQ